MTFGLGYVDDRSTGINQIACYPFYSHVMAMNRTKVDYFSLVAEGDELKILQTVPFEILDISVSHTTLAHVCACTCVYVRGKQTASKSNIWWISEWNNRVELRESIPHESEFFYKPTRFTTNKIQIDTILLKQIKLIEYKLGFV